MFVSFIPLFTLYFDFYLVRILYFRLCRWYVLGLQFVHAPQPPLSFFCFMLVWFIFVLFDSMCTWIFNVLYQPIGGISKRSREEKQKKNHFFSLTFKAFFSKQFESQMTDSIHPNFITGKIILMEMSQADNCFAVFCCCCCFHCFYVASGKCEIFWSTQMYTYQLEHCYIRVSLAVKRSKLCVKWKLEPCRMCIYTAIINFFRFANIKKIVNSWTGRSIISSKHPKMHSSLKNFTSI